MLRALGLLFGFGRPRRRLLARRERPYDETQLGLELEARPRDAAELRERLVELGLDPRYRCRLTSNRTVLVSHSENEIRIHRGYLDAQERTWRAIVAFVQPDSRAARNAARRELVAYPVHRGEAPVPRRRVAERTHRDDESMAERLRRTHAAVNRERFGGSLAEIPIRVSRRMKSRLGHYTHRDPSGEGAEIVISRRHIRRHGWSEAIGTLVHEMVHQWQDEGGLRVDHGTVFRAKARSVGISPRARSIGTV